MPAKRIVGVGAGGHAKVIVEILRLQGNYDIVGLLDAKAASAGSSVLGVPVLGGDELLPKLIDQIEGFFIAVGSLADGSRRKALYERCVGLGLEAVSCIHPSGLISPSAKLGSGCQILARATVCAAAQIGKNVIVNTGAIVEHDCTVGDHVHVATGAVLTGGVSVGSGTLIGAGSIIRQALSIGANAIIGAGAVVVRDVPEGVVAVGVPAKIQRTLSHP